MRGPTGDGGTAPRIVNLGTKWDERSYISFRLSPGKEIVVSLERGTRCVLEPSLRGLKTN